MLPKFTTQKINTSSRFCHPGDEAYSEVKLYIPVILYLLGFIFLLISLYREIRRRTGNHLVLKMLSLFIAFSFLYWVHITLKIPAILKHVGLFSAQFYAISKWLPSLGDFFLITILFFFLEPGICKRVFVHRTTSKKADCSSVRLCRSIVSGCRLYD